MLKLEKLKNQIYKDFQIEPAKHMGFKIFL